MSLFADRHPAEFRGSETFEIAINGKGSTPAAAYGLCHRRWTRDRVTGAENTIHGGGECFSIHLECPLQSESERVAPLGEFKVWLHTASRNHGVGRKGSLVTPSGLDRKAAALVEFEGGNFEVFYARGPSGIIQDP